MLPIDANVSLNVNRTIKAPREKVFDAFVIPELRKQWWRCGPGDRCTICDIDARVGGRYRINMIKDGNEHIVGGEYLEVVRPEKLVFTWTWEAPTQEVKDSLVTIVFKAIAEKLTEVTISHERFATSKLRDLHAEGWAACLASAGAFLE